MPKKESTAFPFSNVVKWLELLSCGGPLEYRSPSSRKTASGNFDDFQALAAEMESRDSDLKTTAHYVTLNVTRPELMSRYANRIEEWAKSTTSDADIDKRNWLMIDVDPVRPAGISSNDEEHKAARSKVQKIGRYLKKKGFTDPVYADSGNGYHALFRIDLPNDETSTEIVGTILTKLATRFDDKEVTVDQSVFNAARITKLYGTWARKGDSTTDRPHRRSKIVKVPKELTVTPREVLEKYAGTADAGGNSLSRTQRTLQKAADVPARKSTFDVLKFLAEHQIGYKDYKKDLLKLDDGCPFFDDSTHANATIRLVDGTPTGKLGFKCLGGRCAGKTWKDFREHYEPGYRDKKQQPVNSAPESTVKKRGRPPGAKNKKTELTPEQLEEEKAKAIALEATALEVVDALNKEIAFFIHGGSSSRILHFVEDEQHMLRLDKLNKKAAEDLFAPVRWYDADGGGHSAFGTWFNHPKRREYTGLTFVPSAPGAKPSFNDAWFNCWPGWHVEPKEGDASLWWKHVLDHICSGDKAHLEWIKSWLAQMIQHPETPAWTAIVLRGPQGAGKGIFAQALGEPLMGKAFVHIKSADALTSKFNKSLENKIYAYCDESFWAGNKNAESILKGLITEDLLSIEPKGVDRYDVANRLHLIIASNESWVVPVGPLERRFNVFDVLPNKRCDEDYFNAIMDQLRAGGYEAILHELSNYDLEASGAPNPRAVFHTEALSEQKLLSADLDLGWWFSVLERGQILTSHEAWTSEPVPCEEMYNDYCDFVRKSGIGRPGTINSFGRNLRKLVPGDLRKVRIRKEFRSDSGYETVKRVNCYEIPSLTKCIAYLEETKMLVAEDPDAAAPPPPGLNWGRKTKRPAKVEEDDDDE